MTRKSDRLYDALIKVETGAVRKDDKRCLRVGLVYPNAYAMGMSNLGFQTVYGLLNRIPGVACERVFLLNPPPPEQAVVTMETGRRLSGMDMIAFSISYENDYLHILTILDQAGLPLLSEDRTETYPLVIAGGVACSINPEPVAPFMDGIFIGEAEAGMDRIMAILQADLRHADRPALLARLARNVGGFYAPGLYTPSYFPDGRLKDVQAALGAPKTIRRVYAADVSDVATCTQVMAPNTAFDAFLVEVSRGCPHGCRFCAAGFVYRPPRFCSSETVLSAIDQGALVAERIGLVGAAVSDFPDIGAVCARAAEKGVCLSFSSLRADALSDDLLAAMKASGVKTATIAPDAGSERMRRVINKGLTKDQILDAAETLVSWGIPNLKLYFMVGLPTETDSDAEAVATLCKGVKERFLDASRKQGRIGTITVSVNPFTPKPFTPFQWASMSDAGTLKRRIRLIKTALKGMANIRFSAASPKMAQVQALLSRGNRRVSRMLMCAHANGGNWTRTFKEFQDAPEFYITRHRDRDERFPWEIIDNGVARSYLWNEYQRALSGKTSLPCDVGNCGRCGVCGREMPSERDPAFQNGR